MPTAEEIFIQYYRFAIQEIELIRIRNCKLIKERQFVYDQERRRAFDLVIQYFENELDQINSELHAEVPDPEVLIWRCVSALNRLEKSHFLMSNLIEAVKRDESLQNVLIRYQHLEIFSSENGRLTEECQRRSKIRPFGGARVGQFRAFFCLRIASLFGLGGPLLRPDLRSPQPSRAAAVKEARRAPRSGAQRPGRPRARWHAGRRRTTRHLSRQTTVTPRPPATETAVVCRLGADLAAIAVRF